MDYWGARQLNAITINGGQYGQRTLPPRALSRKVHRHQFPRTVRAFEGHERVEHAEHNVLQLFYNDNITHSQAERDKSSYLLIENQADVPRQEP